MSSASSVGSRVKRSHESRHSSDSVRSFRSASAASASQSKTSSRNRSVANDDNFSIGSRKSKASSSSSKSPSSSDDSVSPRRSTNSVSSRRSARSYPSFQEQLALVPDKTQRSSDWSGSGSRSSPRSVASHASLHSHHSRISHRSSSSRKSSKSHRSSASVKSHKSARSSHSPDQSVYSSREKKISSLQQKGKKQMECKRFPDAIKSFTLALMTIDDCGGSDGDATYVTDGTTALLYRYRCEALYGIGLYELAAQDARKALTLFEQSTTSSGQTDGGLALRGKILSLLGYSILRTGRNLESARKAFEDSVELMKEAIDSNKFLSENEQPSASLEVCKGLLNGSLEDSKNGLSEIAAYETLFLKDSSQKGYVKDLDNILLITPDNIDLHVQKIKILIIRKRWFEVANHCEQMAARTSRYCSVGIFKGDLQGSNPFPEVDLEALDPDYFERSDIVIPQHLRLLPPAATCEAASLLPKEILPYYVMSLRLEDRCDAAVLVGRFLQKTNKGVGTIDQEWQKLNKTIKLRKEANLLFRNGKFDQAASLYKQCLEVCSETNAGGQINAILHYNRGSCFYATDQYQDACSEFTHAISIHSMYSDAILQRARCHVQLKDMKKASDNFNRYLTLVRGTHDHPYPPKYKGSNCYFNMPGDVTYRQVESIKAEMRKYYIVDISGSEEQQPVSLSFTQKLNAIFTELCCKNGVADQVVVSKPPTARRDIPRRNSTDFRVTDGSNLRSSISSRTSGPKLVRFHGDPPSHATTVISSGDLLKEVMDSEFDTKNGTKEP